MKGSWPESSSAGSSPRIPVLSDIILPPTSSSSARGRPRLRPDILDEAGGPDRKDREGGDDARPAGKEEVDGRSLEVVSEGASSLRRRRSRSSTPLEAAASSSGRHPRRPGLDGPPCRRKRRPNRAGVRLWQPGPDRSTTGSAAAKEAQRRRGFTGASGARAGGRRSSSRNHPRHRRRGGLRRRSPRQDPGDLAGAAQRHRPRLTPRGLTEPARRRSQAPGSSS